jgi:hypothetical protein
VRRKSPCASCAALLQQTAPRRAICGSDRPFSALRDHFVRHFQQPASECESDAQSAASSSQQPAQQQRIGAAGAAACSGARRCLLCPRAKPGTRSRESPARSVAEAISIARRRRERFAAILRPKGQPHSTFRERHWAPPFGTAPSSAPCSVSATARKRGCTAEEAPAPGSTGPPGPTAGAGRARGGGGRTARAHRPWSPEAAYWASTERISRGNCGCVPSTHPHRPPFQHGGDVNEQFDQSTAVCSACAFLR